MLCFPGYSPRTDVQKAFFQETRLNQIGNQPSHVLCHFAVFLNKVIFLFSVHLACNYTPLHLPPLIRKKHQRLPRLLHITGLQEMFEGYGIFSACVNSLHFFIWMDGFISLL
uniref:Uncharacterized protein n=1 Tax=Aegilops tauschii subsp. strangulata TaxID=200361 RepID=A0A453QB24_AEGTS